MRAAGSRINKEHPDPKILAAKAGKHRFTVFHAGGVQTDDSARRGPPRLFPSTLMAYTYSMQQFVERPGSRYQISLPELAPVLEKPGCLRFRFDSLG